jgi:hypothetical protein
MLAAHSKSKILFGYVLAHIYAVTVWSKNNRTVVIVHRYMLWQVHDTYFCCGYRMILNFTVKRTSVLYTLIIIGEVGINMLEKPLCTYVTDMSRRYKGNLTKTIPSSLGQGHRAACWP